MCQYIMAQSLPIEWLGVYYIVHSNFLSTYRWEYYYMYVSNLFCTIFQLVPRAKIKSYIF